MKKTYTFSEARQKFAAVLEQAEREGEARIIRKNGSVFVIRPERRRSSPLDVPGVKLNLTREEILSAMDEGRDRLGSGKERDGSYNSGIK